MNIQFSLSGPRLTGLGLLLALAACSAPQSNSATAPLPKGAAIGETIAPQQVVRFSVVDATPASFFNKTLLVEGTVKDVCQTRGCWMIVEDEGHTAQVRWETGCGGKYAFPKDSKGKRVLIQGSFYAKETSPEDAAHMEQESGHALSIPLHGYEFNASAVIILDTSTR